MRRISAREHPEELRRPDFRDFSCGRPPDLAAVDPRSLSSRVRASPRHGGRSPRRIRKRPRRLRLRRCPTSAARTRPPGPAQARSFSSSAAKSAGSASVRSSSRSIAPESSATSRSLARARRVGERGRVSSPTEVSSTRPFWPISFKRSTPAGGAVAVTRATVPSFSPPEQQPQRRGSTAGPPRSSGRSRRISASSGASFLRALRAAASAFFAVVRGRQVQRREQRARGLTPPAGRRALPARLRRRVQEAPGVSVPSRRPMSNSTTRCGEKSERLSSASETASAGASSSKRRTSVSVRERLADACRGSSTKNSTSPRRGSRTGPGEGRNGAFGEKAGRRHRREQSMRRRLRHRLRAPRRAVRTTRAARDAACRYIAGPSIGGSRPGDHERSGFANTKESRRRRSRRRSAVSNASVRVSFPAAPSRTAPGSRRRGAQGTAFKRFSVMGGPQLRQWP